jgi:hypothetical protein
MLKKSVFLLFSGLVLTLNVFAQGSTAGLLSGNIQDENKKSLEGATVKLVNQADSVKFFITRSDKTGNFQFSKIPFGWYALQITFIGFKNLKIDSLHFRDERFDFNLTNITLHSSVSEIAEVIIYAEKPLIESKEGNITFNAAESALAAGSNASELLNNVPLVSKDPSGKILVRGKEPKILIDDKPVELNLQQLQDLLESMPGSSIEKIEVMTNPPPQYANEQGGIINIVTRKGKVGLSGRISLSAGTRGEGGLNGNFNYRKNKFAININAGAGINRFEGNGHSSRKNIYADSVNFFNTRNNYVNKNTRPNFRVNIDYDIAKNQTLNFVANYNQNDFNNKNITGYSNLNRFDEIFRLSERAIRSEGNNYNPNFNLTYTLKGKTAGEQLRIISGATISKNKNNRTFYQEFFNPDCSPNGIDSTQEQITDNRSQGFNARINYDKPLVAKKTFLSIGTAYSRSNSHIETDASYIKKPEAVFVKSDILSNNFKFRQEVTNLRISLKQVIGDKFSITAGLSAEATGIVFELLKEGKSVSNRYWSFLPFANINKNWNDNLNLTVSYRRSIRRPGINELNPTIDFSDPYNVRFGNYQLGPSMAHNFDLVMGKTKPTYFLNLGMGYTVVENIFSQLRTLLPDGKTQVTWENISNRKEYEISTWNGYTVSKKIKLNVSAGYTFNEYSEFDKTARNFRNGGSFTSTINGSYSIRDSWNFTGNFTSNRFANPQGSVNWNLSMNVGIQKKFFEKKFIVTINFIDPFRNQRTNSFTYGKNFELRSFSTTQTRNYRLTLAYNFSKATKKNK